MRRNLLGVSRRAVKVEEGSRREKIFAGASVSQPITSQRMVCPMSPKWWFTMA